MRKTTVLFLIFLMAAVFSGSLQAVNVEGEQANQTEKPQKRPELFKKIIKVNYIDLNEAHRILRPFVSPWGRMEVLRDRGILIIDDTSDSLAKMISILEEIDKAPLDLQFHIELIMGMAGDEGGKVDKELMSDPVIKELRTLLKYKSFQLLDSSLIKVQDGYYSNQRMGGEGISLKLRLRPRYIKEDKKDTFRVDLGLSHFQGYKPDGNERTATLIDTVLNLEDGQRTVVGVSKLNGGDKALILIISGKVLK
ncbi:MAG: hypothetical protein JXB26_20060 [Candidatus Aminicenantes bacterium]|nr:hypothetical protein [Candidatus Aminicenantes bacterium]